MLVATTGVCVIALIGLGCSSDAGGDALADASPPAPRATCQEFCDAVYSTPCFVPANESLCLSNCPTDTDMPCADELAQFYGCAVATNDNVRCGVNQYPVFLACRGQAGAYNYCACSDCT